MDAFTLTFCEEIENFKNCTEIRLHKTTPDKLKVVLQDSFDAK